MSSTVRRMRRVNQKKYSSDGMSIDQMIEAGYLIPATKIRKGQVYTQIVKHDDDCLMLESGDICTCETVEIELFEYNSKGKINA